MELVIDIIIFLVYVWLVSIVLGWIGLMILYNFGKDSTDDEASSGLILVLLNRHMVLTAPGFCLGVWFILTKCMCKFLSYYTPWGD